jgi:hypothetical protein
MADCCPSWLCYSRRSSGKFREKQTFDLGEMKGSEVAANERPLMAETSPWAGKLMNDCYLPKADIFQVMSNVNKDHLT